MWDSCIHPRAINCAHHIKKMGGGALDLFCFAVFCFCSCNLLLRGLSLALNSYCAHRSKESAKRVI